MSALDVLRRSREFLGEGPHRWLKLRFDDTVGDGPPTAVCAIGAIDAFSGPLSEGGNDAALALRRALPDGTPGTSIMAYNDATYTSYEDVLSLFDRAIEDLEHAPS